MRQDVTVHISRKFRVAAAALVASATAICANATAAPIAPPFSLDRPVLNPGASRFIGTGGGRLLDPGALRLSVYGHYQHSPLVLYRNGSATADVVGSRWAAGLAAAYALNQRFEFSLHLPFILSQSGDDASGLGVSSPASSGLGTPDIGARVAIFSERLSHPVDLSFDVAVTLPFGSKDALASDNGVGARMGVGIGKRWGAIDIGGDAGIWLRPSTDTASTRTAGNQVMLNAGAGYNAEGGIRFELTGLSGVGVSKTGNAFELLGGMRVPFASTFEAFALAGPGFGRTPGTPMFRALLGVAYVNKAPEEPVVEVDPCGEPRAPVAQCPQADWDQDGIVNVKDQCPMEPEDKDEFEDVNGCPDPDNDQDGILDVTDKCPLESGTERFEGCPPPDADEDGVFDPDDECPLEPGPVERKGCPNKDADDDGVLDEVDNCVNVPGPASNQGCPKQQKQRVQITKDKLIILDKVFFASNKATIKPQSFGLLDQVSQVLIDHPNVKRIRVEGHTDDQGRDDHNLSLSQARAEAVRDYLVDNGVATERLVPMGYGENQPLESNRTNRGRATNRRVEFIIVNE